MDDNNKDKFQEVQPTWEFSPKQIEMKKDSSCSWFQHGWNMSLMMMMWQSLPNGELS